MLRRVQHDDQAGAALKMERFALPYFALTSGGVSFTT